MYARSTYFSISHFLPFIVLTFHFGFLARDFIMALEASQTEEYLNRAAQFEMEPGAPIEDETYPQNFNPLSLN